MNIRFQIDEGKTFDELCVYAPLVPNTANDGRRSVQNELSAHFSIFHAPFVAELDSRRSAGIFRSALISRTPCAFHRRLSCRGHCHFHRVTRDCHYHSHRDCHCHRKKCALSPSRRPRTLRILLGSYDRRPDSQICSMPGILRCGRRLPVRRSKIRLADTRTPGGFFNRRPRSPSSSRKKCP